MRKIIVVCVALIVIGCGGGGDNNEAPPSSTVQKPQTLISGVVFASGVFTSGVVNAYSYTSGVKGSFLATSAISSSGTYSLNVPRSSSAILIEAGNGCYTETAIPWSLASNQSPTVSLAVTALVCTTLQKLSAVVSIPSNAVLLVVAITPYTHAGVGLAEYLFRTGSTIDFSLSESKSRLSQWVGVDIQTTLPSALSRSSTFAGDKIYSSLLSGIPSWLFNNATTLPSVFGVDTLTTIYFSDVIKSDLAQDGVLNGVGRDTYGSPVTLSVGNSTLTTTIYRHQLAFYAAIRVRAETEGALNSTPIEQASIVNFLPSLVAYNDATNSLVDASAIITLDEGGPVVSITVPSPGATLTGNQGVGGLAHDSVGIPPSNTIMLIDGALYTSFVNQYIPNNFINTTIFSNGPHTITIKATNNLGHVSTASINVSFSN